MLAQAVLLTAFSAGYGYERDELYFRALRPGWGYLDQPPLTPLLARLTRHLIADQTWALRIPATIASVLSVLVIALIAREVGGGRLAQTLAAWGYAFAGFPLAFGHILLTTTIDEPVWLAVLLFIIRAVRRNEERSWLIAGVLVGLGLYNKLLIVVLLAAVAIGIGIIGPRRLLISRGVLIGIGLAVLIGLPNLIYQASHHWPQLEFGRQLAAHNGGDTRAQMWPLLFLMLGPPLTIVWGAGLVALWRRPEWRPIKFLAVTFPVLLVLVFLLGSQPYYPFGLLGALFAVGCVPTADWLVRGGTGRVATVAVLGGINALVSAVIALPLTPLADLGNSPIPGMNQTVQDSVGWKAYVRQIAAAYHSVPAADRPRTTIVASNYGEAGALDRYGAEHGLPHAYSAHNQLYFQGRPPADMNVAVIVGGQAHETEALFSTCRPAGHLDNGLDVDNEEQQEPIVVCQGPQGGWGTVWPRLKHED
jgi:hypothetical protein